MMTLETRRTGPFVFFAAVGFTASGLAAACTSSPQDEPTGASPAAPSSISATVRNAPSSGLQLTSVAGAGSGLVNVTPTAKPGVFTLNSQDQINVHGTSPDTLLYVLGSADVGLPGGQQTDGVCNRAVLGFFAPIPLYPGGPPATLQTSAGGAGAVHIVDGRGMLPEGGTTDLMIRVVDALPPATPTIDLRTRCFTLEVR